MLKSWNHWLGWTTVLVVAADWLSKFWIQNQLSYFQTMSIIDGWLSFVNLENRGIAFSLFGDSTAAWRTPVLVGIATIVLFILARIAREITDQRARFGIALVSGGALGNLGDRIANGGVTDFIAVDFFPYIFNLADAAIVTGAILLTIGLAKTPPDLVPTEPR